MSTSLEKLVANLPDEAFKYTLERLKNYKLKSIKQKRAYPYDYMDSFEELDDFYTLMKNINMFKIYGKHSN